MKKYLGWVILGVALTYIPISLGVWFLYSEYKKTVAQPTEVFVQTPAPAQPQPQEPAAEPTPAPAGSYQAYSPQAFAESTAKNKLLFFHAQWCPQCRMLEKSIEQTGVPSDVAIFKVDYDKAIDLRQKYGVTLQTTVVQVANDGTMLKKHVAYANPTLPPVLEALGLQ